MNISMPGNFSSQEQEKQLFLLQIANSSFPTGAFNHSYGFETWFSSGAVYDAQSFRTACRDWMKYSLARSEGVAVALACDMARFDDCASLPALDRKLGALKLSREARDASSMTGQALLAAYEGVFGQKRFKDFTRMADAGTVEAHHAVVFGAICGAHDIGASEAVLTFLQGAVTSLAGVACRLIPLGQVETQRAITDAWPFIQGFSREVLDLGVEDMNTAMLSLDLAAMQHETLRTRLCIS